MRFSYSVSALDTYFRDCVRPLFQSAIDEANREGKDLRALTFWCCLTTIETTLKVPRLSASRRGFLERAIDNIIPLSSDSAYALRCFREMLTARS